MPLPVITIIGNLTADPELRATNSGKYVCNLRVAANERKKLDSGEWVDSESIFLDVNCWRNPEGIHKTLAKGSRVLILGTLRANDYEKDGVKIKAYRVNADEVSVLVAAPKTEIDKTHNIVEGAVKDPWGNQVSSFATTEDTPF